MKLYLLLPILLVSFFFVGCASKKKKTIQVAHTAPDVVRIAKPLEKAQDHIKKAQKTADAISKSSKAPSTALTSNLVSDLSEANKSISTASQELKRHESEIKQQTQKLNESLGNQLKLQEESQYWQEKHHKALKKLWFWRGLALAIAAIIVTATAGWVGWKVYGPKFPKFF